MKFSSCQRLTREGKLANAFPMRFPAISFSRTPTNPIFKASREKAKKARSSMMRVNLLQSPPFFGRMEKGAEFHRI